MERPKSGTKGASEQVRLVEDGLSWPIFHQYTRSVSPPVRTKRPSSQTGRGAPRGRVAATVLLFGFETNLPLFSISNQSSSPKPRIIAETDGTSKAVDAAAISCRHDRFCPNTAPPPSLPPYPPPSKTQCLVSHCVLQQAQSIIRFMEARLTHELEVPVLREPDVGLKKSNTRGGTRFR